MERELRAVWAQGQFLMPGIISSVVARFTTEQAAAEIESFFADHPVRESVSFLLRSHCSYLSLACVC
jgi:hypothetical protein